MRCIGKRKATIVSYILFMQLRATLVMNVVEQKILCLA